MTYNRPTPKIKAWGCRIFYDDVYRGIIFYQQHGIIRFMVDAYGCSDNGTVVEVSINNQTD